MLPALTLLALLFAPDLAEGSPADEPPASTPPTSTLALRRPAGPVRVEVHGDFGPEGRVFLASGGRASALYPAWAVFAADLDADGSDEVLLGVYSHRRRHAEPEPHRTVWVIGLEAAGFVERWRGSALAHPLRDLRVLPEAGGDLLLAAERRGDRCGLTAYRWHGFGFGGVARRPVPCLEPAFAPEEASPRLARRLSPRWTSAEGPRRVARRGTTLHFLLTSESP